MTFTPSLFYVVPINSQQKTIVKPLPNGNLSTFLQKTRNVHEKFLDWLVKVVTYLMFNIGNNRRCILAQKMATLSLMY